MNAFFSGSLKVIDTTDPFRYPANLHKSNGTNFDPQKVKQKDVDPFTV